MGNFSGVYLHFPHYMLKNDIIYYMYNWSTDTVKLKQSKEQYIIWKLTQMINYGLDGQKLQEKTLIKYWTKIKNNIDPYKRRVLEYLIWENQYLLPNNLNFWNVSSKKNQ